MDFGIIYEKIKQLCKNKGITISQLEKGLGFSVGAIGKWRQYSPSVEKVLAVAEYFNYSLDELCCIDVNKGGEDPFLAHLYSKVSEREIVWVPCSLSEKQKIQYGLGQVDFAEAYYAEYNMQKVAFLMGISHHDTHSDIVLYISVEGGYFKELKKGEGLSSVWEKLKEQEEEYNKSIQAFLEEF